MGFLQPVDAVIPFEYSAPFIGILLNERIQYIAQHGLCDGPGLRKFDRQ